MHASLAARRPAALSGLALLMWIAAACSPEEPFRAPAPAGPQAPQNVTVTPSTMTLSQGETNVVSVSAADPYYASTGPLPYGVLVSLSSREYPPLDSVEVHATATATPGTHPIVFGVDGYSSLTGYDTLMLTVDPVEAFDLDWTSCPDERLLWFGMRDGLDGPWSAAPVSGGDVSFSLSQRVFLGTLPPS